MKKRMFSAVLIAGLMAASNAISGNSVQVVGESAQALFNS